METIAKTQREAKKKMSEIRGERRRYLISGKKSNKKGRRGKFYK